MGSAQSGGQCRMPYTPAPLWRGPAIRGRYWGMGSRRGFRGLGDDTTGDSSSNGGPFVGPPLIQTGSPIDAGSANYGAGYSAGFQNALSSAAAAVSSAVTGTPTSPAAAPSTSTLFVWGAVAIGAALMIGSLGGRR
jgi:hypothetical protein